MNCEQSMYAYMKEGILDKDKDKIIFYNNKISGAQLLEQIDALAFYLIKLGVQKGDAVGICLPNIPQAAISFYAINRIGAVANVIHPKISANALGRILEETKTKVLFLFDKSVVAYEKIVHEDVVIISCAASEQLKGIKKIVALLVEPRLEGRVTNFFSTLAEHGEIDRQFSAFDAAVYLHSSGTTGAAKTVILSSYAFNMLSGNVVHRVMLNFDMNDELSMLMVLPLFHGFGLGICLHLALSNFKIIMMPKFKATDAITLIKKHKIDIIAGIPAMFEKMLKEKGFDGKHLSSLQYIFCGADRLNPETKTRFDEILKKNNSTAEIFEGYGLSEVASVATVNVKGESKAGTQGKPILGTEIKIVDENMQPLPFGENGEVLMKHLSVMNGYLHSEDSSHFYFDSEGEKWLKTGDIGSLDEEGYFTYKGREKRIIKIGGVNIFPAEIEEAVCKLREVDEACIVRCQRGGKPCTKLIIKMNKSYRYSMLIEQKIKNTIAEEFIKYAVPKEIVVTDRLPKTLLGKVDYRKYEEEEMEAK